ncbi:hypothetical protein PHYBOEH_001125 [Phytophthora boehmeriae]|uniref:BRCT domain-containing protein n=1 Tax=Phytophthora boehmeriae TaxID=109152 RepID=A0A8T1V737_9STRA|nr:hypothetical protein PHYBOEH_001125 [Phytophthora boehmeriae]
MQEQWEAAQLGLRVFLDEDTEYVQFLSSFEELLTRRLRFAQCSRAGSLVENVDFDRFAQTLPLLQSLHALFQGKLKLLTDLPEKRGAAIARGKCNTLVQVMADMLSVLRVPYAQLFSTSDATQTALEQVLALEDKSWDADLLENYLMTQKLTAEKLVERPLQRFNALVEFVEALSTTLANAPEDEAISSNSDASVNDRENFAPRLMHIAQENRHYVHLAKADARAEQELIELQTCFQGEDAENLRDLSQNKLLLQGEVMVSRLGGDHIANDVSSADVDTATHFTQIDKLYGHCFEDGTLVCSKRQVTESGNCFTIQHRLQLKHDAVFFESLPDSVQIRTSSDKAYASALIIQDSTLILAFKDATENQRWADTIGGFLEMNGTRTDDLSKGRTLDDLPIPEEITAQCGDNDTLSGFPSFYDDYLPGIFWMVPAGDNQSHSLESSKDRWEMVELVFFARWLLIFKLDGWKGHSILRHFDTSLQGMDISEQQRGEKEWSLVISCGDVSGATLVSKKRTRIDYWFDQVSKAVGCAEIAARRAESEERERLEKEAMQRERKEMEGEEAKARNHDSQTGTDTPSNEGKKKRKRNSIPFSDAEKQPTPNVSPASSNGSKPDDRTDEENGDLDKRSTAASKEGQVATVQPSQKRSRRSSDRPKLGTICNVVEEEGFAAIASPVVKTPKRKWLKRKSDDPNDTALVETQPSPIAPTDESTSEVEPTQASVNETTEVDKPKDQQVRIILTGVEITPAIRKKIDAVAGAVYEEDIEKATHVLAPKNQLKRTVKLLCGISCCVHILDVRWLDESARVGAPVYERAHCLKDTKAETKWHFDLTKTMYDFTLTQRRELFAGKQVFITNHKSVLPPVKDLVKIVECAGGKAVTKGSAGPDDLVVTSEAAMATASVRKTLSLADPKRIYSPELILSGILQQHIDLDKNHLARADGGSRRRR